MTSSSFCTGIFPKYRILLWTYYYGYSSILLLFHLALLILQVCWALCLLFLQFFPQAHLFTKAEQTACQLMEGRVAHLRGRGYLQLLHGWPVRPAAGAVTCALQFLLHLLNIQ